MTMTLTFRRRLRRSFIAAFACTASLLLSGCFLSPGEFTSRLELNRNGTFAFSYDGQIHMLAMDKLAEMEAEKQFTPFCVDDETYEERDCTEAEIAAQRSEWDADAGRRNKDNAEKDAFARAMLGGIDPEDEDAIDQFVARLLRQKGWKSVEHEGDGVFRVSFAIGGRTDHDFLYPTMEGFPLANYFVTFNLRDDGSMRVAAPAFGGQGGSNPMQGMLAATKGLPGSNAKEMPNLPELDGEFTIVTDGTILANNTDEGPQPTADGRQMLGWMVNSRTLAAPTALIQLAE